MLIGWCWFAAAVLIVSFVVHVSTFLGIDPMARWPGVMFFHFPPFVSFIAAIYYANRVAGPSKESQDRLVAAAPRWLKFLAGILFAYAIVNFAIFMVLNEGGGPEERNGKYLLTSHGKVLRELTEDEFHQQQAFEVRGFSGHWMGFSGASLMLLVGTARLRRSGIGAPAPTRVEGEGTAAPADISPSPETVEKAETPPEPTTVRAGLAALVVYLACLAMVFSGQPVLGVLAVPPVVVAMVLCIRRRRGFPRGSFESCLGCLAVFPNAVIASFLGKRVAEFIYLTVHVGLVSALTHEVAVTFPKEGPSQLSNGVPLDNGAWSSLMLFVQFPLFVVGTLGLTYLAEQIGRLVEVRRRQ